MKKPNKKDYNFYNKIDLFKYVNDLEKYTDHLEFLQDPISKILKSTPYTVEEITDFIFLTGIEVDKTVRILLIFDSCGIPNLNNINTLAKMDMLKLESI
jgi:hypothetical protein